MYAGNDTDVTVYIIKLASVHNGSPQKWFSSSLNMVLKSTLFHQLPIAWWLNYGSTRCTRSSARAMIVKSNFIVAVCQLSTVLQADNPMAFDLWQS